MKKRLSQIWQQLRTSFSVGETVNTTVETGQAVLEAAKTLQEQGASIELLKPLLQNSSSLLDVLCSPLAQVVGAGLPFVPLGIALLKFSRDITQQDPSLADCVFILSKVAYLESTKEILSLYSSIQLNDDTNINQALTKQLQKLNDIELDYKSASKAVTCFHESELAIAFNEVLFARLEAANIPNNNINILTQRVAWNTHRYIIQAWIESGDAIKNIIQPSFGDWQKEQQKFSSIDEYLKIHIASKPLEQVFDESFSFKDIYVPLKIKPVNTNGEIDKKADFLDLETWAKEILLNPSKLEQVMFVQGGPGRGKSVFCRMFSDWVRQHLHPIWTPILIRLRDLDSFEQRLENTLQAELKISFIQNDKNWLTNKNTRFLFILDGFDELHIEARTNLNLEAFIKQVSGFQQECKNYQEMRHRVLITGRSMSLQGIPHLPRNLERVEIVEMDGQLQQKWLDKWEELPANKGKTAAFGQFLQSDKCPSEVKNLAQEPLLLYLLAAMYRDGKLAIDKLEQANQRTAKIIIYQEALNWVLTKQRSEADGTNLNTELTQQKPEDLKRILTEAAVCVVQSGGEFASMSMLEARLQDDETAKALIEKAKEKLGNEALKTALAAFYIRPADKQEGGVEFFHKSFGEFLFAERLKTRLKAWTQYYEAEDGRQLVIPEAQMNWQIYDLLGFGRLTPEIMEYLMGLLTENQSFPWEQLFKRLEKFYGNWCKGKFIDSAEETLPQKKLRQLQKYGIQELGQRQIDIYAGLNVMVLLLELNRYAQERDDLKKEIIFYLSGQPQKNSLTYQLVRIINYSDCIQLGTFNSVVGQFLRGADLSRPDLRGANLSRADLNDADLNDADLRGADLSAADLSAADLSAADLRGVDLSRADLSGADLSGADLSGADLRSANLISADLRGADLSGADLSGTDLRGADLSGTDLRGADLSGADLSGADLSGAYLSGTDFSDKVFGDIRWDENTKWDYVKGLDTAGNVPEALKQQLGLSLEEV
ncbi:low-complexity protein [Nostoc linckia z18]|uniref:Low-complexity protein n=2 Tax=Nostoc linckia TaxID=92942 RepID=A0A9Q6EIY9_NOSLI|nr:pentapeptide repeat-containing protein [Nostoc linckia]PHK39203.1 low-complexity protein [Nostoc linckia z15]PHK43733.1 low-complexity protein [Nostoc linckia z16]PHJ62161.1 low-complexity protein [Nostoc linckia z1]PHJ77960.1 low-complexity protein [Nostoc linckia z2]PHJ89766.1 low-complexity protein [Nostoc linckia z6]